MTAIITAIVITVVGILDYWWPHFEERTKAPERTRRVKFWFLGALIVFGWAQAGFQFYRDIKSDSDMDYLRAQLDKANNSTWAIALRYRWSTFGGHLQIDPPSMRDTFMIDN